MHSHKDRNGFTVNRQSRTADAAKVVKEVAMITVSHEVIVSDTPPIEPSRLVLYNENLPIQYTENFKVVKNENFQ